jgi:DNA (cytosine-5)-methyltransferase 1
MTDKINSKTDQDSADVRCSSVAPCYTVLDLFSGIGGFSLGLERTGGFKTVAFCEFEDHAQKILKKHWPNVPIFKDVRELHGTDIKEAVDVICGGFPCQDLSCAGKQKGITGDRSSLYGEMLRLISECVPKYAIFENVTALLNGDNGRWFAKFLYDLASVGYDAEWHCIQAAALGANHERDRIWVIAYPKENGDKELKEPYFREDSAGEKRAKFADKLSNLLRGWRPLQGRIDSEPDICRIIDGVPDGMDRLARLGNAVVPQIPELIGRAILDV